MATPPMIITEEFAQKLLTYLSRCPYAEVYLLIQELQSAAQPPEAPAEPQPRKRRKKNVSH